MPPFSLSDAELEQLMVLATPLPPQNRSRFFEAVSAEVQARGADCVGPGTPHRIGRQLQSQFLYALPQLRREPRSRAR